MVLVNQAGSMVREAEEAMKELIEIVEGTDLEDEIEAGLGGDGPVSKFRALLTKMEKADG